MFLKEVSDVRMMRRCELLLSMDRAPSSTNSLGTKPPLSACTAGAVPNAVQMSGDLEEFVAFKAYEFARCF